MRILKKNLWKINVQMGDSRIIISTLVGILILGTLGLTHDAYAFSGTLTPATCIFFGWNWDGVDTCTKTDSIGNVIASGQTLTVPSGIILVIPNTSGNGISVSPGGSIVNWGTIITSNSGNSAGISNNGFVLNLGSIILANTGTFGLFSTGTITNSDTGSIMVSNSANFGLFNLGGTVNNHGSILVDQTGIRGITNSGGGTFNNKSDGTITLSNSSTNGHGMSNSSVGGVSTVNNSGSIIIVNSNNSFGLTTSSIFNNALTGSITVANTSGLGLSNSDTFDNLGFIGLACGATYSNIATFTGNPILDLCDTANLQSFIENVNLATNVEKSLSGPLKKVFKIIDDGNLNNDGAACDKLDELIANVESKETSGKIDSNLADIIIDMAESIKDDIGTC